MIVLQLANVILVGIDKKGERVKKSIYEALAATLAASPTGSPPQARRTKWRRPYHRALRHRTRSRPA
jgi:hypothetical protein